MRKCKNETGRNASNKITNKDTGDVVVNRIVANPCKIKTQIAKISFSSEYPNSSTRVINLPPPPPPPVPPVYLTAEIFEQNSQERKNEMEQVQSHIMKIGAPTPRSKMDAFVRKDCQTYGPFGSETEKTTAYRRSKTEGSLNRPLRSKTARTASTLQLDTLRDGVEQLSTKRSELVKSHENIATDSAISRRRAYDPAEARLYMKQQRKKRKKNEKDLNEQRVAFEKEQIRKRLEELEKSSRAIITKNLKKNRVNNSSQGTTKQSNLVTSNNEINSNTHRSVYSGNVDFMPKQKHTGTYENVESAVQIPKDTDLILTGNSLGSSGNDCDVGKHQNHIAKSPPNGGIIENQRRVGLMRKAETKDHSFSAIKEFSFDKENVALEMLTPKIATRELSKGRINNAVEKPAVGDYSELPSASKESLEQPKQSCDLPYWLRSSAVQIYPYNFIQAVRRKIESVVEPVPQEPSSVQKINSTKILGKNEQLMEKPSNTIEIDGGGSQLSSEDISAKSLRNSQENKPKSRSLSDFNSNINLSSLSLPMPPPSNTVSEVSSIRSESIHSMHASSKPKVKSYTKNNSTNIADDTTVSSSVFSCQEKRHYPKNNSEHSKEKEEEEEVEEEKILDVVSLEPEEDKFKICSSKHKNVEGMATATALNVTASESENACNDVDFNKLLSDFNHGLSQVIEANEQLKFTLDRSQKVLIPVNGDGSTGQQSGSNITLEEYTSDFDDITYAESNRSGTSLSRQMQLQEQTTTNNKVKNTRTHQHFKVSMPLLISPKSDCDDEYGADRTLVPNVPELNLNCITASSVHTSEETGKSEETTGRKNVISEETATATASIEILTPREHEERLATIDQLKANLRRMISDSKVERRAIDREEMLKSNELTSASSNSLQPKSSKRAATTAYLSPNKSNYNSSIISTTYTLSPPKSSLVTRSERANLTSKVTYRKAHNSESTSRNITEDITDYTHESSTKTSNTRRSRTNQKSLNFHEEPYIQSHINTSRGDYTPDDHHYQSRQSATIKRDHFYEFPNSHNEKHDNNRKTKSPSSVKTVTTATTTSKKSGSSKIITTLRISDLEISRMSSCDGSISESSLNYSNVGLYEQLIKNETTKSEYLTAVMKMREKAILDRTKGQIAWLEVQKERYKSKGLMVQIAAIRKKQRALLIKMEKEREEIKRILESTQLNEESSHRLASGCDSPKHRRLIKTTPKLLPSHSQHRNHHNYSSHSGDRLRENLLTVKPPSSAPILRASYELEPSASLEELLRQREEDLRKRRQHVEHLMEWHHKLDQEETEVLNLERMLFTYNLSLNEAHKTASGRTAQLASSNDNDLKDIPLSTATKEHADLAKRAMEMERRLKEIDKSLKELNHISATTTPTPALTSANGGNNQQEICGNDNQLDFVRTTGSKLNKLWRRLTSQHDEKFDPNRRYKLCKSDLERIYEEAKNAVLSDFAQAEERSLAAELLDRSTSNVSATVQSGQQSQASYSSIGSAGDIINAIYEENNKMQDAEISQISPSEVYNTIKVPNLNLNFSTSQSEDHEDELCCLNDSTQVIKMYPLAKGDYSPSAAEKNFQSKDIISLISQKTLSEYSNRSDMTLSNTERSELIKRNMRKFLKTTAQSGGSKVNNPEFGNGVERSLSDTELASASKAELHSINGASKCILWAAHQNENKVKVPAAAKKKELSLPSKNESNEIINTSSINLKTVNNATIIHSITESSNNIPAVVSISSASNFDVSGSGSQPSPSRVTMSSSNAEKVSTIESCLSEVEIRSQPEGISRPTIIHSIISDGGGETAAKDNEDIESFKDKTSQQQEEVAKSDFENKSDEIASKLNEISAAVALLSQSSNSVTTVTTQQTINSENQSVEEILSRDTSDSIVSISTKSSLSNQSIGTGKNIQENMSNSDFPSYTSSFESPSSTTAAATIITTTSQSPNKFQADSYPTSNAFSYCSAIDNHYESDLENSGNEKLLDDESMPPLDTTFDTTTTTQFSEVVCDPVIEVQKSNSVEDLCGEAQKTLNESTTTTTSVNIQDLNGLEAVDIGSDKVNADDKSSAQTLQKQLMPDIINELEIRRCQQILLESEQLRQFEHVTAVPYMYVREIPNKPPPPYCPPAHGSPMTTIFPSEDRIKDITYRRTHELYCEILGTDHINEKGEKLPSVLDEQITNIYERIILDICREYLDEHQEILNQGDPSNFYSQLAFFNPPDRLRCIQESIYKEVRRCLAMDKTLSKRTPIYSIYGHRAKRDHVGTIIIQEMYDEDEKWCNFHLEEDEVLELIIEEMIGNNVREIASVVLHEEGGNIDENTKEGIELNELQNGENKIETEIETDSIATTIDETIDEVTETRENNERVFVDNARYKEEDI